MQLPSLISVKYLFRKNLIESPPNQRTLFSAPNSAQKKGLYTTLENHLKDLHQFRIFVIKRFVFRFVLYITSASLILTLRSFITLSLYPLMAWWRSEIFTRIHSWCLCALYFLCNSRTPWRPQRVLSFWSHAVNSRRYLLTLYPHLVYYKMCIAPSMKLALNPHTLRRPDCTD